MSVLFAQIEPTTRCNFGCGFCCGRSMTQSDVDPALVERFVAKFPELAHVELQGEGEPLLHGGFFGMAGDLRAHGAEISMITNGSLLTEGRVAKILDLGLRSILVSLETTDPQRFRELRKGSFRAVVEGLGRLIAERERRGLSRPAVGLAWTVLRSTADQGPAVVALYKELGLDGGIAVQPLNPMPSYQPTYGQGLEDEFLAEEQAGALDRWLCEPEVAALQKGASEHLNFYAELFADREAPRCPWLEKGLHMDRDGELTPCCSVKAGHYRYGHLDALDRDAVLALRAELAADLAERRIPWACDGCAVAEAIVAR